MSLGKISGSNGAFHADKINEIVDRVNAMQALMGLAAVFPLKIDKGDSSAILSIDLGALSSALGKKGGGGGGGGAVLSEYQERQFAVCDNGTPVTYTFLVR